MGLHTRRIGHMSLPRLGKAVPSSKNAFSGVTVQLQNLQIRKLRIACVIFGMTEMHEKLEPAHLPELNKLLTEPIEMKDEVPAEIANVLVGMMDSMEEEISSNINILLEGCVQEVKDAANGGSSSIITPAGASLREGFPTSALSSGATKHEKKWWLWKILDFLKEMIQALWDKTKRVLEWFKAWLFGEGKKCIATLVGVAFAFCLICYVSPVLKDSVLPIVKNYLKDQAKQLSRDFDSFKRVRQLLVAKMVTSKNLINFAEKYHLESDLHF